MAAHVLALILSATLSAAAADGPQQDRAAQIVADYLKLPYPREDRLGEARSQRLDALSALKDMPDEAVDAIERALPQVNDSRRRAELAEALGRHSPTQKSATLLSKLLQDPNDKVRWQAIHGLRLLARRTDRVGPQRVERARMAPKVDGLVPYLLAAAGDEAESNRVCALYALADSRDPLAVAELRNRLKDTSAKVRLHAACFLTEYQDASGLPEMRAALARLMQTDPNTDVGLYFEAGYLLASFERITGKSFGRVPMNPLLSSNTREIPKLEMSYRALLNAWVQWWAWEPPANP